MPEFYSYIWCMCKNAIINIISNILLSKWYIHQHIAVSALLGCIFKVCSFIFAYTIPGVIFRLFLRVYLCHILCIACQTGWGGSSGNLYSFTLHLIFFITLSIALHFKSVLNSSYRTTNLFCYLLKGITIIV